MGSIPHIYQREGLSLGDSNRGCPVARDHPTCFAMLILNTAEFLQREQAKFTTKIIDSELLIEETPSFGINRLRVLQQQICSSDFRTGHPFEIMDNSFLNPGNPRHPWFQFLVVAQNHTESFCHVAL